MNQRHPGRPKKDRAPTTCRAVDCTREANGSKGFCQTHYIYTKRGIIDETTGVRLRPPLRVGRYEDGTKCLVGTCPYAPRNQGMCSKHARQREAGLINATGEKLRDPSPGRKRRKARWVGGTRDGYVLVVAPQGHPNARQDGTICEHRLIVSQQLGRPLHDWEIVHHRDGNRQNNSLENLELLDGRARKGEGHPPGSTITGEHVRTLLEHLRYNNPSDYNALMDDLRHERTNRTHPKDSGSRAG